MNRNCVEILIAVMRALAPTLYLVMVGTAISLVGLGAVTGFLFAPAGWEDTGALVGAVGTVAFLAFQYWRDRVSRRCQSD
jgi:membrane protein implicated in regulation of membrane protease activity